MKSLLVEDDEASRVLIENFLAEYGEVDSVENGKLGLDFFSKALDAEKPYDLVCLDIEMPVMDGQEMLVELRSLEKKLGKTPAEGTKVMMVTIHRDSDNVLKAFREQCDAFLIKPVDRDGLNARLEELELL